MNISRQNIYLLALSVFLLVFVLIFSFLVIIPSGKEYRVNRNTVNKLTSELKQFEDFSYETEVILKKLQTDNRHIITAFGAPFSVKRFKKRHGSFFNSLSLSKKVFIDKAQKDFVVYEVNTTSKITSPQNFYKFLESLNKSDWIIGVNFPINFERENEVIKSSFTMRIYSNHKDSNTSAE